MAGQTEIRTLGQQKFVQFCFMRTMAFCALAHQKGLMLGFRCLNPFPHLRVAGKTEGDLFVEDHSFHITRMGIVTGEAFPFCKRVMVCAAGLRFHQIPMALCAHFSAFEPQKVLVIRSMGTMAGMAAAVQNRLMGVRLQELSFGVGMANVTNPVYSALDNILDIRPVRVVACIAFSLSKRRMRNLRFFSFRFGMTRKA